jgi:hypothetical protein
VNIIFYPINFENNLGNISITAFVFLIIRISYTFAVGYRWGKYSVGDTFFAFFKPLFLFGVIILIFVSLIQTVFPAISGLLLWPASSFILIDIDAYIVITEVLGSSLQGDAAILLYFMLFIYGMIIIAPIVFICFLGGFFISKLIKKQKKDQLMSKKLYSTAGKGKELKFLFLFLAILGTLLLLSFDLSQTRILDQQISSPELIVFVIYETIGLIFLFGMYFIMKRSYSRSATEIK